ncbi:RDD family protein [Aerococcus agrisoli]|uniref:RDD family protein n=1 Tax=Aerococcus agrisoli TaxID=2487350 RepID=A0A3N4GLD9_9LACT|nr:RDD family protein [Aerococcus agrisoli]RPA62398.1 RDD family protein [Aerococcus agrisoli]
MFGRKKKEAPESVELPKLNSQVYEGSIENAFAAERTQRKMKSLQASPQEIFANYRRNLKMDITDGYARNLYAGFWMRLFAFIIDMIMVYALQSLVAGLLNVLTQGQYALLDAGILYLVKQVVLILHFTLASYFTNGQTIGKGLLGLQLVKDNQYKLSFMTCFVREGLGKVILATLPFLGLMVVFSSKRQNFMDYFTDTNVISLNQFAMLYEENVI